MRYGEKERTSDGAKEGAAPPLIFVQCASVSSLRLLLDLGGPALAKATLAHPTIVNEPRLKNKTDSNLPMRRPQFSLKTMAWLVVVAAVVAAATRGSLLAVVLLYWGAAFWWAISGDKKADDWR